MLTRIRMFSRKGAMLLALGAALLPEPLTASPFSFSYGGRLADANDRGIQGPVDIEVKFFSVASGGTPIGVSQQLFQGVSLSDGVFQVDLTLLPAELALVFPGNADAFVEVTDRTHNVTYPRQRMTAIPYAMRVPVDGTSVKFDTNGNLTLVNPPPPAGTGAGDLVQVSANGKLPALDASQLTNIGVGSITGLGSLATISPSGTPSSSTYLRGDGTWATVAGGGLPAQSIPIAGSVLTTNGTTAAWQMATAANQNNTVVERDGSGNFSAGTITASGFTGALTGNVTGNVSGTAANVTGTVGLANGGTGANLSSTGGTGQYLKQSSAGAAVSVGTIAAADLPPMTGATIGSAGVQGAVPVPTAGQQGLFLRGDGNWSAPSASAAGATGQIQFNNGGALGATPNLSVDGTSMRIGIGTPAPLAPLDLEGTATGSQDVIHLFSTVMASTNGQTLTGAMISPSFNANGKTGLTYHAVHINTGDDNAVGEVIKANSITQIGDLTEWQNSSGTVIASIDHNGNATFASVNAPLSGSNISGTVPYTALPTGTGLNQIPLLGAGGALPAVSGANLTSLNAGNVATGLLAVNFGGTGVASATQNFVFAAPSAASGAPSFRSLVAADLPSLDASKITTGQLVVAQGGTGSSSLTANAVLLGNGSSPVQTVAPGTFGNVLTSNGSTWTSAAIPATPWATPGAIGSGTPSTGAFTTLTTTGNVGIGTSSPVSPLQVLANGDAIGIRQQTPATQTVLRFLDSGGADAGRVGINGTGDLHMYTVSSRNILFGNGAAEVARITPSGDVGIGSNAPASKLDVAGTGNFTIANANAYENSGNALSVLNNNGATNSVVGITLDDYNSSNNTRHAAIVEAALSTTTAGAENGFIRFDTITSGTISEKVRITSSGYVGIGTNSPATPLDVVNYISATGYGPSNSAAGSFYGRRAEGTGTSPQAVAAGDALADFGAQGYAATSGWPVGSTAKIRMSAAESWGPSNQGSYITFHNTPINSTTITERMRIDQNGNVGIGTNSPQALLDLMTPAPVNGITTGSVGIGVTSVTTNLSCAGLPPTGVLQVEWEVVTYSACASGQFTTSTFASAHGSSVPVSVVPPPTLRFNGMLREPVATVSTTPYFPTPSDSIIVMQTAGTVRLPTCAFNQGRVITIIAGSGSVTVQDDIGTALGSLLSNHASKVAACDGTHWY